VKYYNVPSNLPHDEQQSFTTCSSSAGFGIYIDHLGKLHHVPAHVLTERDRRWEYEDACKVADEYQGKVLTLKYHIDEYGKLHQDPIPCDMTICYLCGRYHYSWEACLPGTVDVGIRTDNVTHVPCPYCGR